MLVYYVLAFLTSSATLIVLRRQEYKEQYFLRILAVLIGLSLVGLLFSLFPVRLSSVFFLLLQLLAWALFLWGLSIDKRWIAGFVLAAGLLFFIPAIPVLDILSWGLIFVK